MKTRNDDRGVTKPGPMLLVHPQLVRAVQRTLTRYGTANGNLEDGVADIGAELGVSAQVVRHRRVRMKNVLGGQLDAAGIVARAAPGRSVVKKRVG
jgi:hypothetical protein